MDAFEEIRPRWTAGEERSPALRWARELHSSVIAVRLDDTYAWAMAGGVVHRMSRDGGEAGRLRLEGADRAPCWTAVFDGDRIVAVDDERVYVWDLADGKLRLATDPDDVPRRAGDLSSLAVVGGTAVTGTEGGYLLRWDLTDGRLRARVAAHEGYVSPVAISTTGRPTVLSAGAPGTLCFHDLDDLKLISAVDADISCAGWTTLDERQRAVTVDYNGVLNVSDPATATSVGHFHTTARPRLSLGFLGGGGRIVLAEGAALRVVDLRDGVVHGTVRTTFDYPADQIAVCGDFVLAAQGSSSEGRINLLEYGDPPPRDEPVRSHFVDAVAAGTVVVGQDRSGRLEVFEDGRRLGELGGGVDLNGGYPHLEYDGRLVVTTRLAPATVDLGTGHVRTSSAAPLTLSVLAGMAAGSGLIAAVDLGGTLGVWDAATLALRATAAWDLDPTSLAIAELGGRPVILVGTDGGGIRWFDGTDLSVVEPPGRFAERTGPDDHEMDGMDWPGPAAVRHLTVLGSRLVHAQGTKVVCADLATGEPAGPVLEHPDRVGAVLATTVDGVPTVVTSCEDGRLRGWELETGRLRWSAPVPRPVVRIVSVGAGEVVALARGFLFAVDTTLHAR